LLMGRWSHLTPPQDTTPAEPPAERPTERTAWFVARPKESDSGEWGRSNAAVTTCSKPAQRP
jgi:hypothetical protein